MLEHGPLVGGGTAGIVGSRTRSRRPATVDQYTLREASDRRGVNPYSRANAAATTTCPLQRSTSGSPARAATARPMNCGLSELLVEDPGSEHRLGPHEPLEQRARQRRAAAACAHVCLQLVGSRLCHPVTARSRCTSGSPKRRGSRRAPAAPAPCGARPAGRPRVRPARLPSSSRPSACAAAPTTARATRSGPSTIRSYPPHALLTSTSSRPRSASMRAKSCSTAVASVWSHGARTTSGGRSASATVRPSRTRCSPPRGVECHSASDPATGAGHQGHPLIQPGHSPLPMWAT
jgi:hypothetical protein